MSIPKKEFLSVFEIARKLGISRIAVGKKIRNGQIRAEKVGRTWVVTKEDFEKYGRKRSCSHHCRCYPDYFCCYCGKQKIKCFKVSSKDLFDKRKNPKLSLSPRSVLRNKKIKKIKL